MIPEMSLPNPPKWAFKHTSLQKNRARAAEMQKYRCIFCSVECWLPESDTPGHKLNMATAEHVICQAHGGGHGYQNIVMSCAACNRERGSMPFYDYYEVKSDPDKYAAWNREKSQTKRINRTESRARRAAKLIEEQQLYYNRIIWELQFRPPTFNLRAICSLPKSCLRLPGETAATAPWYRSQS